MPRFVVLGNPENRRVEGFQRALGICGLSPARVIPWQLALQTPHALFEALGPETILRIDSPGERFEVERLLIAAGSEVPDESGAARIDRQGALALSVDRGRVRHSRQWYLGFRKTLREWAPRLACPVMSAPSDIEVMFDKRLCQARLRDAGVPVPPSLGPITGYDHLRATMRDAGLDRVFVKLAHGSSASGVVAFSARRTPLAITSLERVEAGGCVRFYNSLRLSRHTEPRHLRDVIDFVCREGAQVEAWIPKARQKGHPIDLRVVVIAGRACHVVVRQGRSPMTNLHLGGGRGDLPALRASVGREVWGELMRVCEEAARVFPDTLYCGADLLIGADPRQVAILELNAFGDLLPGVLWRGCDTWTREVQAVIEARGER